MRFSISGNQKDHGLVVIRNGETTLAIPLGAPVFLALDGTLDGLRVVSAVGITGPKYNMFYGFNISDLNPGDRGEAIVFGFCENIRIMKQSRAASTVSWAAWDAGVIGDVLDFVTDSGVQAMSVISPGVQTQAGNYAVLAQVFDSGASSLSNASDTRTLIYSNLRGLVRAL